MSHDVDVSQPSIDFFFGGGAAGGGQGENLRSTNTQNS